MTLYYPDHGNVGSCSMPFIIADKYNGTPPSGKHIGFFGVAAGGGEMVVTFVHEGCKDSNKSI